MKPYDINSARKRLESTLLARFRNKESGAIANEDGKTVGSSQAVNSVACQEVTFTPQTLIHHTGETNEKKRDLTIDLTKEDEHLGASTIYIQERSLEAQVVPAPVQSNKVISSSNQGKTIPDLVYHQQTAIRHPRVMMHPSMQTQTIKSKKNATNFTRPNPMPLSLNIGGRFQHYPGTQAQKTTQAAVAANMSNHSDGPVYSARVEQASNFHQHFMDHSSEQGVLGAIFINNLLQQSIAEYQNLRGHMYPQILPQRRMMHGSQMKTSQGSKQMYCREFCKGRRVYTSHNQISSNRGHAPTTTTPLTATFTSPSISSDITATMEQLDMRSTETVNAVSKAIAPTTEAGYQTIELPRNPKTYQRNLRPVAKPIQINGSTSYLPKRTAASTFPRTTSAYTLCETAGSQAKVNGNVDEQPKSDEVSSAKANPQATQVKARVDSTADDKSSPKSQTKTCIVGKTALADDNSTTYNHQTAERNSILKRSSSTAMHRPVPNNATAVTTSSTAFSPSTSSSFKPISRPIAATAGSAYDNAVGVYKPGSNVQVTFKRPSAPTNHLKKRRRVVTFAETATGGQRPLAVRLNSHRRRAQPAHHSPNYKPTNKRHKRRLRASLKCVRVAVEKMEIALKTSDQPRITQGPSSPAQISSTVDLAPTANSSATTSTTTSASAIPAEMQVPIPGAALAARTPPIATVTLHHACRFYRCQSVTHPNAVLGMIRNCRVCQGNYTIACGNISEGRCAINLAEIECPKCWNANACYCGEPFSDRYIGGREM